MPYSTPAPASTAAALDEATSQPLPAAPSIDTSSAEVLITEQEVLFSTAAALPARREKSTRRFLGLLHRVFATSARAPRPRQANYPKRYAFLENSLMAREMDRL